MQGLTSLARLVHSDRVRIAFGGLHRMGLTPGSAGCLGGCEKVVIRRGTCRQDQSEDASSSRRAVEFQAAPVDVSTPPRDGQAQAGSTSLA